MSNPDQRLIGTFQHPPRKDFVRVQVLRDGAIQITTARFTLDIPEGLVLALADSLVDLHEQAKNRGGMRTLELHPEDACTDS